MSAALEHAQWTELIGVNDFDDIVGSGIVVLILVAVSLKIKKHCSNNNSIVPSEKFSLTNFFEFLALDFLLDLLTGIFGSEEKAKKFLPLLGGSFLFIFFSNLLGVFPGFYPATQNLNSTLAMALVIFFTYNYRMVFY